MRNLNQIEVDIVSGAALTFDNGGVYIVPETNIPLTSYNIIDSNLQRVIDGSCSEDQFFSIMRANGCMPYLEIYFDNLINKYF